MVLLIARGEKEEARLIEPKAFSDYVALLFILRESSLVNKRTIPLLNFLITLSLVKHKVLRVDVKLLRKDAKWEGVI